MATMFEIFMLFTIPRIRQKDTFQDNIAVYCVKGNTFSVYLACSARRATEAISLALHSVSRRLKKGAQCLLREN